MQTTQKIKSTKKHLLTTFSDPEVSRKWIKEGYTMMNISSPLDLGIPGMKKISKNYVKNLIKNIIKNK